ncbi:glycosyltransferase [Exiguobacterium sp. AT1b]|uniref:glycosyltransferase n=1 Tax=Exiguobacterium sp. (strain ATCC BAA-1283 / AT1b) TaxID=360911 RepID=UPI00093EE0FB|nr:glycosyltransferase [Exiguobacterium sp. AT1b]
MVIIFESIFFVSLFIIFWAMIGYPFSLKILNRLFKPKNPPKNYTYYPTVTLMVVAHNEEKVIFDKLKNIVTLNYPKDKIKYLVASDNSTDRTNEIVKSFIKNHPSEPIELFEVKERKGKTNAQNEAQKTIHTEFIVMTDANSILDSESVRELMASFTSEDISYVTGKLEIVNSKSNEVSKSENTYWEKDLEIREIESAFQTITAGNGALYACRNKDYVDFDPIKSHDSSMPIHYALLGKRAIANHDAIAYEKAGEVIEDEFNRKVRMNRVLLDHILPSLKILNPIKYRWFSYFYFGHRTCRYLLWIAHLGVYISNALLINESLIYSLLFISQNTFYVLALVKLAFNIDNKLITLIYYYCATLLAQWMGISNVISGKSKPFWEKAETTR